MTQPSILSKITTDNLAEAVVKVAQLSARGEDLERLYSPWENIRGDEDMGPIAEMEERYRMTKMALPKEMGTVIPQIFNYEDYTEKEIIKVHQRKTYMPMDELQGYKQYTTRELQGAIKDVFANNLSGMMLSAAAGWGKSTIYEYFGAMAAQHSLTHKELWMKPGVSKNLAGMKDPNNIQEQHFIKFDASNLGQTEGLKGRMEQTYRELEKIIKDPRYSGIYTFVIDELYSALASDSSDASEAWNLMKGYLAPDPHIKVIGTFASEDLKKFKEGKNPRTGENFYNPQMQRRMPLINMRDYNRPEGIKVLENGFDAFAQKAGLPKQIPDANQPALFNTILDKADLVTDSSGHVVFGLPARIEKVLRTAGNEVRQRIQKFEKYKMLEDKVEQFQDFITWSDEIIPKISQEKNEVLQGRQVSDQQIQQEVKEVSEKAGVGDIISIRDLGGKFPHEEVESPEAVAEGKKEKAGVLDELAKSVQQKVARIKQLLRVYRIELQQGINKIKSKHGDIFSPDFKDIGNVKQQDVETISQHSLIMSGVE